MNFSQSYNRSEHISFLQNNLLSDSFSKFTQSLTPEFKPQYLKKAELIGKDSSLELDVWEIEHESENDPRVGVSKDIFRLMANYGTKRILAIITSSNSANYRLSLATVELSLDGSKVKKHYSNPRRYSFFLGPDSKTHTPEQFLIKKGRIKDFDDLLNRFSVEVVNKEFYNQIAFQFSELVGGQRKVGSQLKDFRAKLKLPSTNDHGKQQEFAVRLIGRLVFCWFLKKKKSSDGISLIDDFILSSSAVKNNSDYYHSALENLFFQILNTPIPERIDEFKKGTYKNIPFLNGGLFEPHGDDHYKINERTGNPIISYDLKIPDKWFIEFFEILEIYNFTIDENTSVDVDLSVDPEMLGRIFENLLAEINPVTGETARKSTGSYYTPRPIVEYMVDESLKQYLLTKTEIDKEILSNLVSYSGEEVELTEREKQKIVTALDEVKILDPACGSGAFPIGVLQKMLLILQKVDPESSLWFNKMLSKIDNTAMRNTIKEKFKDENLDYIRKLGIIQETIYGVDIQTIAVEISKLRCFLTLIVDEEVDDKKQNRGIIPLPNLEFKFVAANTLMGLPKKEKPANIDLFDMDDEVAELKELRNEYFRSYGKQKEKLEQKFVEKQKQIAKSFFEKQSKDQAIIKLTNWNPFVNETSDWFDPDWMFGIKEGFDIIIANPPYVEISGINWDDRRYYETIFKCAKGRFDLYVLFIEKALQLKAPTASFTYIVPGKFLNNKQFSIARRMLCNADKLNVIKIDDKVFEAQVDSAIIHCFFIHNSKSRLYQTYKILGQEVEKISETGIDKIISDEDAVFRLEINSVSEYLIKKIRKNTIRVRQIAEVKDGIVAGGIKDVLFIDKKIDKDCHRLYFGKHLSKYAIEESNIWVNYKPDEMMRLEIKRQKDKRPGLWMRDESIFKREKILYRKVAKHIIATYDNRGRYYEQTIHSVFLRDKNFKFKYLLGLLNSALFKYYYQNTNSQGGNIFPQVRISSVENLPIKSSDYSIQALIEKAVDYTLLLKENERESIFFEQILDAMVYELYLPEEIKSAGCEVLKNLSILPALKNDWTNEKKLRTIEKVYKELSNPNHPVSKAMFKMNTVKEVKIINPEIEKVISKEESEKFELNQTTRTFISY